MRYRGRWARSILAVGAAAFLALSGSAGAAPNPQGAQKKPAAREGNWPRNVKMGDATLSLDAPQAESLDGTKLTGQATAVFQRTDEAVPVFGTLWYEADVEVDRDQRTVTLVSVRVPRVQFEGVPAARQQAMTTRLSQALTRMQLTLPLDDVLAEVRIARRRDEAPPKLNTDPPKILFETEPAILVVFDGEPRFRAVEGSRLERALNTPFLVLREPGANAYYLDGGTIWFRAPAPAGPWTKADKMPPGALEIASRDLKSAGVAASEVEQATKTAEKRIPKIVVATEPTELIVADGAPQWGPAVDGELEALSNSESDVFRTTPDQQYWVVLSGRWYKSGSLGGPWAYVQPDRLPQSFRKIPSDSPKADILSFVPGTGPAREALADASKPRTAAIRRSEAHVTVNYDGDPKFEPVPGTHVEYALNTAEQVLRIRGRYFVCDQGVWFTAGAPSGPWAIADSIPDEEIQTIPPESPVYNTRYAYVYDSTPELVYTAYTPAYLGSYPYYGGVVYGTGYFYRPWWGAYYYPRPWTWGFHARYAPWAGWGYGFSWGPGWGGFRYGFGYGWGSRWCGPGAFFRPAFYHPGFYRPGVRMARNVNITRNIHVTHNLYASGANKARASTTTHVASRSTTTHRQAASKQAHTGQGTHTGQATHTRTEGTHTGPSGHSTTSKAGPEASKARPQQQKGGKAGGHSGGVKHGSGKHGG